MEFLTSPIASSRLRPPINRPCLSPKPPSLHPSLHLILHHYLLRSTCRYLPYFVQATTSSPPCRPVPYHTVPGTLPWLGLRLDCTCLSGSCALPCLCLDPLSSSFPPRPKLTPSNLTLANPPLPRHPIPSCDDHLTSRRTDLCAVFFNFFQRQQFSASLSTTRFLLQQVLSAFAFRFSQACCFPNSPTPPSPPTARATLPYLTQIVIHHHHDVARLSTFLKPTATPQQLYSRSTADCPFEANRLCD